MTEGPATVFPGGRLARAALPVWPWERFARTLVEGVAAGARVAAMFGVEGAGGLELVAVLAEPNSGRFALFATPAGERFPSLTPACPQVHLFEREIAEQFGVVPEGHPWLKPVRFHASWVPGRDAWGRPEGAPIVPSVRRFYSVEGEEIHEVAVGPVHAGMIEPGHFRFQCHGERVLNLEISLGYQHRGVERALAAGPDARTVHLLETAAGDTTIAHATAYCQAVEALGGFAPSHRADRIRAVALELERIANHVGDLGALAGDVGFLPTASYCGRMRGDVLNLTALLCGSRFGRGLVRPGGVGFDVDAARAALLVDRLEDVLRDVRNAVELLFGEPSVQGAVRGDRRGHLGPGRGARPRRTGRARLRAWSATPATSSPRGSTASRRFRCPRGPPATWPGAPTCAGWRCSARRRSCASSWPVCRRAPAGRRSARPLRTAWPSRWSRGGAARSATWPSPARTGASSATRSWIRPSTTGCGLAVALRDQADLRFPAVQQELQPLLLRPRPVAEADHARRCCSSHDGSRGTGRFRSPPAPVLPGPVPRAVPAIDAGAVPRTGAAPAPPPVPPAPSR